MNRKRLLVFTMVVAPLVLVAAVIVARPGPISAQGPGPQGEDRPDRGVQPDAPTGPGFTYQGRLKDGGGNPIDSTCDFTFGLWNAATSGSQVGGDSVVTGVAVTQGYFSAVVNGGGEFGATAFTGEERWLEIAVQCTGDPAAVTLSPRQQLTAAPYALSLQPGATISGTVPGGNSLTVVNNDASGRAVYGYATASSGPTYGVVGESGSADGRGVYGYARATSGFAYGVYGESDSTAGTGVRGRASATSGSARGVVGISDSTDGRGVYGEATAVSGTTYGVVGWNLSTAGTGVRGRASATSGTTYGVRGESVSAYGRGVYGYTSATSGSARGVVGISDSTSGVGVYGEATATSGSSYGVAGISGSTHGRGVHGQANATSGPAYGVFGYAISPDGYGVYYVGGLGGIGLKSSIVQTADFGWRHLYSVESTGPWFEDFGSGQLAGGQATVLIDPIFAQTVNLEQIYQVFLTPLGDCGLYVAEQTATSFTVRALDGKSCSIAFHYRIVAKRLGYEDTRLAAAQDPALHMPEPEPEVQP